MKKYSDLLDKLTHLNTQATEGPWTWEPVGEKDNSWCLGTEFEGEVVDFIAQSGSGENFGDPTLIVGMRNALPDILVMLDQLRRFKRDDEACENAGFRASNLEMLNAIKFLKRHPETDDDRSYNQALEDVKRILKKRVTKSYGG